MSALESTPKQAVNGLNAGRKRGILSNVPGLVAVDEGKAPLTLNGKLFDNNASKLGFWTAILYQNEFYKRVLVKMAP